jgi:acyl carrier protein
MMSPSQAMQRLAQSLRWNAIEIGIANMDWSRWAEAYPRWTQSPKYQALLRVAVAEDHAKNRDANSASTELLNELQRLQTLSSIECETQLTAVMTELLAPILETTSARIDVHVPLPSLGMDSLMALDFQVAVERHVGIKIPMLELMKGNSVAQLATVSRELIGQVIEQLASQRDAAGSVEVGPGDHATPMPFSTLSLTIPDDFDLEDAERLIATMDAHSDDDIDRLLQQLQTHNNDTLTSLQ